MTDSTTTNKPALRGRRRLLLACALLCIGCRGVSKSDREPAHFQSLPIPSMRPDPATVRACGFQDKINPISQPGSEPTR
ncbi:hypothetical protein Poly21_38480 [Allorhodopirellula heiligendammensis]|uniref:Uncharacterized protein n=1 Tax=Allorhodopirellula heiligendammensis TaxID=2714739 RepID=A0A5C6BWL1_9BACT|nr:hypothetical protein Poly21_38480 [Allorhodopirellula heiligendammensis]